MSSGLFPLFLSTFHSVFPLQFSIKALIILMIFLPVSNLQLFNLLCMPLGYILITLYFISKCLSHVSEKYVLMRLKNSTQKLTNYKVKVFFFKMLNTMWATKELNPSHYHNTKKVLNPNKDPGLFVLNTEPWKTPWGRLTHI